MKIRGKIQSMARESKRLAGRRLWLRPSEVLELAVAIGAGLALAMFYALHMVRT